MAWIWFAIAAGSVLGNLYFLVRLLRLEKRVDANPQPSTPKDAAETRQLAVDLLSAALTGIGDEELRAVRETVASDSGWALVTGSNPIDVVAEFTDITVRLVVQLAHETREPIAAVWQRLAIDLLADPTR